MRAVDSGPADASQVVVPSDTVLQPASRGIYVGTTGNITGQLVEDLTDRVFTGLAAGVVHPLRFKLIKTASTASNMLLVF